MDEVLYTLEDDLLVWVSLLGTLVAWDSPSLGMKVSLLQYSYGIVIVDDTVGFFPGSELGFTLSDILHH